MALPITAYRPPSWGVAAADRTALHGLVTEALADFEPVAVTHGSASSIARRLREGFGINEYRYRPQMELFGSIQPGELLHGTTFASLELRPRGSGEPVLGIERYGEVALHWTRPPLEAATITPILSGTVEQARMFGRGLHAGTVDDLPDIVTDALIVQNGEQPIGLGTREWLPSLLSLPREQALHATRELFGAPGFHRVSPEAILRGAAGTSDAVEAVSILASERSPDLDAIRAWARGQGVPVHERAVSATAPSVPASP